MPESLEQEIERLDKELLERGEIMCPYCDGNGCFFVEKFVTEPCYWCHGEGFIPSTSQNKDAIFND